MLLCSGIKKRRKKKKTKTRRIKGSLKSDYWYIYPKENFREGA